MGNAIHSMFSGFTNVIADTFGKPLDFLSGKQCGSVCGSTWDIICYIEQFCVANLLKLAAIVGLVYLVLVFFYLLYKVGICHCISRGICKMLWSCIASSFSACEYACMFLCYKMRDVKRERRGRRGDIEEYFYSSSSDDELGDRIPHRYTTRSSEYERAFPRRAGDRKKTYLERALRPRSHRTRVGISRQSVFMEAKEAGGHVRHQRALHNIKVTKTSRFVHKGSGRRMHYRRW